MSKQMDRQAKVLILLCTGLALAIFVSAMAIFQYLYQEEKTMNKWQELAERELMFTLTEYQLRRAIIRALDGVDDPAEAVIRLYGLISKINQLADTIDEVAARETRIQLAQANGLGAVTGELNR